MPYSYCYTKFAVHFDKSHTVDFLKNVLMKTIKILLFVLFNLQAMFLSAQYSTEISSKDLKSQIGFLASDSLKGRKPGTAEDLVSAKYILHFFEKAGLKPLYNGGFQEFDVITDTKAGSNNSFKYDGTEAVPSIDFIPLSFSSSSTGEGNVAFAGYGFEIDLDTLKWNDYKNIDVKGKWVIVLRGDPEPEKANSAFLPFEQERAKVLTAKDKGAIGVLFVTPTDIEKNDVLMHMQYDKSPGDAGLPVISIKRALANQLLSSMNYTVEDLEAGMKKNKVPNSLYCEANVKATTDVIRVKVQTQNVAALLTGKHPELKNEYVVIGAHFDHLGFGGVGSGSRQPDEVAVHNGADDNASGTAGVIELAQFLSIPENVPDRSIIFVSFAGEEMGLLGSKEFIKNPPVPLKKITSMINMDMIGRLNPITKSISVGGTGTSLQSDSIITNLEKKRGFKVSHSPDGYGPSDHAPFYSENIPVFYFTTGAHEDYHTPTDDADKIDYDGEVSLLNMVADLARIVGDKATQLTFKESGSKQSARYGKNMKVTLGIVPDMVSADNNGLGVDGVRKGGPAERAGILKGDKVISIDGHPVTNIYDYMARLGKLLPGQVSTVEILRDNKKQLLIVQF